MDDGVITLLLSEFGAMEYSSNYVELLLQLDHTVVISTDIEVGHSIEQFLTDIIHVDFGDTE